MNNSTFFALTDVFLLDVLKSNNADLIIEFISKYSTEKNILQSVIVKSINNENEMDVEYILNENVDNIPVINMSDCSAISLDSTNDNNNPNINIPTSPSSSSIPLPGSNNETVVDANQDVSISFKEPFESIESGLFYSNLTLYI